MRYELGDKVEITACWKPITQGDYWQRFSYLPSKTLEEHLMTDDMAGTTFTVARFIKTPCSMQGYIVGKRRLRVTYDLEYLTEREYIEDGIEVVDYIEQDFYLVATGMNCIRKVSFEDIRFLAQGV